MTKDSNPQVSATGRRKTSIARIKALPGKGKLIVNSKSLDDYFRGMDRHKQMIMEPIGMFSSSKDYNFEIKVAGGGVTGQAGAIRHGISRIIIKISPDLRGEFKKAGLLTRDPRMVERKKPGRPKARKRFQYSKR